MRKSKSNIYNYLNSKGVLEKGTHEEIQQARNEYWNEYKRNWRKDKRKKEKEFTISLNSDELKTLTKTAKYHKVSRTAFIKQTAFAYINTSFIVPDNIEVKRIAQLLAMTYNTLQELIEEDKVQRQTGIIALEKIRQLEREVLPLLNNPQTLEEYIRVYVKKGIGNKQYLLDFINKI